MLLLDFDNFLTWRRLTNTPEGLASEHAVLIWMQTHTRTHKSTWIHRSPEWRQPGKAAFPPWGGLWDHKKCVLSESRKQRGVGLQLTREAAHVSRRSFYQRKRGKGTRGEARVQLSPLNILSQPAHSARTHARTLSIKRHKCLQPASCVKS